LRGVEAGLIAAVALAGCGSAAPAPELAAPRPLFRAGQFFSGRTEGRGTLKVVFKDAQQVRVEGVGRAEPGGTLVLDQVVWRGSLKPQKRQWRIRPVGQGRYEGTLTDATGPVRGEVKGNLFHVRYPMKGGVNAEQWIYLQPDGRTALNQMKITKLGVTVGRLEETIRKLD
jgi:hypothetical protein